MKRLFISLAAALVLLAGAAVISNRNEYRQQEILRVAHNGSPNLAPLFAAYDDKIIEGQGLNVALRQFGDSTDAGLAMISGQVDAVFLEPAKAFRLLNENDDLDIKIAGTVNFDFGSTLIVREGLNIRLHDLEGLTIAAGSRFCLLLSQFKHDAQRYGVNVDNISFVYMDFATMLPALEAAKVDGILTRASYSLNAQEQGHTVLYQNWDVVPGDACCPAYLAQVEYFLMVKDVSTQKVRLLDNALAKTSDLPPDALRRAIADFTQFPSELLKHSIPVASYSRLSQELKQELGEWAWTGN